MPSTLLLIPTQFEWNCFSLPFLDRLKQANITIELCGFGPIVAGIRSTQLIAQSNPDRIWLAGIAGGLQPSCIVGSAVELDDVVCYGIGAGSGSDFLSASEMGWQQWPSAPMISDTIRLDTNVDAPKSTLLTCCAASANKHDVQMRLDKYRNAIAEDMEGFAVAAACQFAGIPLRIVRGISNRAGDRDKANWRVASAMAAVEEYIEKAITT